MTTNKGDEAFAADAINVIFNRFLTIVHNPKINPPWYSGSYPWAPSNAGEAAKLGPQAVTAPTNPATANPVLGTKMNSNSIAAPDVNTVFNAIHGFANNLTRIRTSRAFYNTNGTYSFVGANRTALSNSYLTTIPIPPKPTFATGTPIKLNGIDTFMNTMNTSLNALAAVTVLCCHSSCHGSCHGSRGRR